MQPKHNRQQKLDIIQRYDKTLLRMVADRTLTIEQAYAIANKRRRRRG